MEISAIFLVLAVLILVGMYLYAPFTARASRGRTGESHEVSALKAERDRVIDSLQELDFDHSLGKIPAEDYPSQRAGLLQKGVDILRKLDELVPSATSTRDVEAHIKKAAAVDAGSSVKTEKLLDEEIESMIAARRKQHKNRSAGFCPKCGKPVLISDKFCPACGKSLA